MDASGRTRLAQEIHEILTKDPELDATEIGVEVKGGAVTLTGEVHDPHARLLAEELVELLPGVREVHNRLSVGPRGLAARRRRAG